MQSLEGKKRKRKLKIGDLNNYKKIQVIIMQIQLHKKKVTSLLVLNECGFNSAPVDFTQDNFFAITVGILFTYGCQDSQFLTNTNS